MQLPSPDAASGTWLREDILRCDREAANRQQRPSEQLHVAIGHESPRAGCPAVPPASFSCPLALETVGQFSAQRTQTSAASSDGGVGGGNGSGDGGNGGGGGRSGTPGSRP